jgi:4-amino-4-deoxy-L-arabinose transferase-like glycosyltransferase
MVAVGLATQWTFYGEWISGDLLPKIVSVQELHGAPPGSYLLLLGATFWPGSLAMGLGVVQGFRHRERYAERFCLAWLIPTWLFFEVMPTKLPHYLLPTYPALALLVAGAVYGLAASRSLTSYTGVVRTGFVLWGILTLTAGAVVVAAAMFLGGSIDFPVAGAALAAAVISIVCVQLCWSGHLVRASWVAVVGSVALFAPLLQWVLPDLQALWLSPAAAAAMAQQTGVDGSRPLVAVGYYEPSLVFLAGASLALVEPQRAVTFLKERSSGLVLVSDDMQPAFAQAAGEMGVPVHEVWSVDGINYSKGQRMQLHLFERLQSADSLR